MEVKDEIKYSAKIGIITFHCVDDLGGMLQAYALFKYLSRLSPNVEIINYCPFSMVGRYWIIPYFPNIALRSTLITTLLNLRDLKMVLGRKRRMQDFRNRFLETSHKKIRSIGEIGKRRYDYYVTGSDQVWNPQITFGLDPAYFGHFKKNPNSKVIAYAPSLGSNKVGEAYMIEMKKLLLSVDYISTREMSSVPFLKKLTDKEITPVLDPVFLLNAEDYEEIMTIPKQIGYILIYLTSLNDNAAKFAERLANYYGKRVVILNRKMNGYEGFDCQYQCGSHDFIGWINHADFVITNSFHATVLSIIFKKKFYVFSHPTLSTRTTDILRSLGLESRILTLGSELDIRDTNCFFEEDIVGENLDELRKKSENYLLNSLNYPSHLLR